MCSDQTLRTNLTVDNCLAAFPSDRFDAFAAGQKPQFVVLVYPNMALRDLVLAQTVFQLAQGEVHLVWKTRSPLMTDSKVAVMPTTTFCACLREPNVLVVPGSAFGSIAYRRDSEVLAFLAECSARANYVIGLSSGCELLRAAGALQSMETTCGGCSRYLLLSVSSNSG